MAKAFIDKAACVGCEACVVTCQVEAISISDGKAKVTVDECIGCWSCVTACPTSAISIGEDNDEISSDVIHIINSVPISNQSSIIEEKWLREH